MKSSFFISQPDFIIKKNKNTTVRCIYFVSLHRIWVFSIQAVSISLNPSYTNV